MIIRLANQRIVIERQQRFTFLWVWIGEVNVMETVNTFFKVCVRLPVWLCRIGFNGFYIKLLLADVIDIREKGFPRSALGFEPIEFVIGACHCQPDCAFGLMGWFIIGKRGAQDPLCRSHWAIPIFCGDYISEQLT